MMSDDDEKFRRRHAVRDKWDDGERDRLYDQAAFGAFMDRWGGGAWRSCTSLNMEDRLWKRQLGAAARPR